MSSKKQYAWTRCAGESEVYFPIKSFKEHNNGGRLNEYNDDKSNINMKNIKNGFIQGRMLFGKPRIITNEKLKEKRNVVVLNPSTVKVLGLFLGSPVLLHANNRYTMRKVWPSSQMPLDCIGMHECQMKNLKISENEIVIVRGHNGLSCHANEVVLTSCESLEFDISAQFQEYLTFHLENQFVIPGDLIDVMYYGDTKTFIVTSVAGDHGTFQSPKKSLDEDSNELFTKKLAFLSLNNDNFTVSNSNDSKLRDLSEHNDSRFKVENGEFCDDVSVYYSFKDDSINESLCENNSREAIVTSTPVKAHEILTNNSDDISNFPSLGCIVYYISAAITKIVINARDRDQNSKNRIKNKLSYECIGGVDKQIKMLKEMIELSLKSPSIFQTYGLTPPRGVLLYGPSGTGKSLLANIMISESAVYSITLNGPDIISRYYGESEAKLRELFQEAEKNSPSIIFIDEIDALCPKRDRVQNEFEKRLVATLLTLMDGLTTSSSSRVFILAATNRPDSLDLALRRPGRFEKEIELSIPQSNERMDILMKLLRKIPHNSSPDEVDRFASNAHGYVGADLMAVVKEACMIARKRNVKNDDGDDEKKFDQEDGNSHFGFIVSSDDIRQAFQRVLPSGLREVTIDIPKVYWSDVGGNAIVKEKLKQAIEWPLKHPEAFTRMNIDPPKGILMYGPPGCSKTLIAKALATESGLNFIAVKGPEIFSKWVGDSEKAIRQVFRKARSAAPCIVFIDEIDGIAMRRSTIDGDVSNVSERVLTQLLMELDGVETLNDVTLVAATNRPDVIDNALMRPGRIDRIIYIPLPDKDTRTEIFGIHLRKTPLAPDADLDDVICKTEGYSGAEITAICREAALAALQEDINAQNVKHKHFTKALETIKPRTSPDLVQYFKKFQENCGVYSL